jgi:hypothetical protein
LLDTLKIHAFDTTSKRFTFTSKSSLRSAYSLCRTGTLSQLSTHTSVIMSSEVPPTKTKIYHGGCHCKANRYEVELSPLDKEHTVISCNCSICQGKNFIQAIVTRLTAVKVNGYLLTFTEPDKVKWTAGGPETPSLVDYTFNKMVITHQFCPTCGSSVSVFGTIGGVTKTGINVSFCFPFLQYRTDAKELDSQHRWDKRDWLGRTPRLQVRRARFVVICTRRAGDYLS